MRFESHILPPSKQLNADLAWRFVSLPSNLASQVLGSCMVGDEAYLFTAGHIYVYNMVSKQMADYPHGISISNADHCMAYKNGDFVNYNGCISATTYNIAINIKTKQIIQVAGVENTFPTGIVVDTDKGTAYAFGGMVALPGITYAQVADSGVAGTDPGIYARPIYFGKRMIDPTSGFTKGGLPIAYSLTGNFSSRYRACIAPNSIAGYYEKGGIWMAACTYGTVFGSYGGSSYPNLYTIYYYSVAGNAIYDLGIKPAFCGTIDVTSIPYSFLYKGQSIAVYDNKIYAYHFPSNSIDTHYSFPNAPITRPNQIMPYKDSWVTIVNNGIYTLDFLPENIADIGGILKIYPGQKYRGNRELVITNKATIKPQWQTATDVIEIKIGEYISPESYTVYIESE